MTRGLSISLAALICLQAACTRTVDETRYREEPSARHVQFLHLDGFRSDVFRALLESGRLPHFEFLASRGRISYDAATVDKSETMKAIQSYLTSRLDTHVVGWWQFNRSEFRFRNFWLDPAEVLNYALGLEFPRYPTIQDYLRDQDENLVAGMSLARRGVSFQNYGRAYLEGAKAVYDHSYYNQADATMGYFLDIHERIARSADEKTPAFSNLLLAAADELSHLHGVTTSSTERERCFVRGETIADETVFRILDEDQGHLEQLESRYFTQADHAPASGEHRRLCVALPELEEGARPHADYVLAMTLIDMELGYLIDRFRSIRFDPDGRRRFEPAEGDLIDFMDSRNREVREDSLFERTLFVLFGDHGMVDTRRMMVPPGPDTNPERDPRSQNVSFLDYLNKQLELQSAAGAEELDPNVELGIDYVSMPDRLSRPYRYGSWQSEEIHLVTAEADRWAQEFFEELKSALRANLHDRYWWLFFLRSLLVDPRLDTALDPVASPAIDVLTKLYLRGESGYAEAEAQANRDFFDRHVRLVYGGGARNNAELFLPSCERGRCTWEQRPSYEQVLRSGGGKLFDALQANSGVGLIYVREENEQIRSDRPVPPTIHIRVVDRQSNSGRITVRRDESGRLMFGYRVDETSARDPLGYEELGRGEGTFGTYSEWNDRSAKPDSAHVYHNAVAGVGAYLYSNNPAIGDVLVLHSSGWNFGNNGSGHGGIHRGEKKTVMLVSGPGVNPEGILMARGIDGQIHYPTLLDMTPTALAWLGYPQDGLESFSREGFAEYLIAWNRAQRGDILEQIGGVDDVQRALDEAGFSDLRIEKFSDRLERLLKFVALSGDPGDADALELPDYSQFRTDGNILVLTSDVQ